MTIAQWITVTAECMGEPLDPIIAAIYADYLKAVPETAILSALKRIRLSVSGLLTLTLIHHHLNYQDEPEGQRQLRMYHWGRGRA